MEDYMLPCLNKKLFGVECLGCGLQRAIALLLQGEFAAAFFMYPAVYPLLTLLSVILFNFFRPIKYYGKVATILGIITAVTMVVSYIVKHFLFD